MNQWILLLIVGAFLLIIGLGILTNLEFKEFKLKLERSGPGPRVLVTLGLICIAIALIALIAPVFSRLGFTNRSTSSTSPSATSTSASPSATATSPCTSSSSPSSQLPFTVTIFEPEEGSNAPLSGVRVVGDVEGQLGNCFLWLFTYSDGLWYVAGPIVTLQDGSFEQDSGPLGIEKQKGKTFSLRIVAVDEAVSDKIANSKPDSEGGVTFSSRPGQLMVQRQVKRI